MGKYYGAIGYSESKETKPGVWTPSITERKYSGDVIRNSRRYQSGENLNDNLTINNEISIVADPYAYKNFHLMKYIEWMGDLWTIVNIDVQRPRLFLTIGGVYNGPKVTTT